MWPGLVAVRGNGCSTTAVVVQRDRVIAAPRAENDGAGLEPGPWMVTVIVPTGSGWASPRRGSGRCPESPDTRCLWPGGGPRWWRSPAYRPTAARRRGRVQAEEAMVHWEILRGIGIHHLRQHRQQAVLVDRFEDVAHERIRGTSARRDPQPRMARDRIRKRAAE